jgi:hypothetical protein
MNLLQINHVELTFSKAGETVFVAIKPICEALGIDHSGQVSTIKNHPILGSVMVENPTTGSDGKTYNMLSMPLEFVFGWLMGIDARKVSPDASESVVKYQKEAYRALYEKFFLEPVQQKKKLIRILEKENQMMALEAKRKELGADIKMLKEEIETIKTTDPTQFSLDLD